MARRSTRRRTTRRRSRRPARRRASRRSSRRRSTRRSTRRRSTRRRSTRRRSSQRKRKRGSGRLRWEHVTASVMKSRDPLLKGRLRLDRGSGVLEFPTPAQFVRIARQEGVPSEKVQRAFGHLIPKSRPRKKRRRSSRNRGLFGWLGG